MVLILTGSARQTRRGGREEGKERETLLLKYGTHPSFLPPSLPPSLQALSQLLVSPSVSLSSLTHPSIPASLPSLPPSLPPFIGAISTVGFAKLQPFLADTFNLQDTCGIHNLHGMPGTCPPFLPPSVPPSLPASLPPFPRRQIQPTRHLWHSQPARHAWYVPSLPLSPPSLPPSFGPSRPPCPFPSLPPSRLQHRLARHSDTHISLLLDQYQK